MNLSKEVMQLCYICNVGDDRGITIHYLIWKLGLLGLSKSAVSKLGIFWPGRRPSAGGPRPVEAAEEPPGDPEGEPSGVRPAEGPPT